LCKKLAGWLLNWCKQAIAAGDVVVRQFQNSAVNVRDVDASQMALPITLLDGTVTGVR
jgi:hypothetical protein